LFCWLARSGRAVEPVKELKCLKICERHRVQRNGIRRLMVVTRTLLPEISMLAPSRPLGSSPQGGSPVLAYAAGAQRRSVLGELAFASLWLLVFAIPWEDAIAIPGFGTGLRVIGMIATGLGILAIIERGRVRSPAIGHFLLALFVTAAGVSYLWSLDPEQTLIQTYTYIQLLTMVLLIWEFAAGSEEQLRLMQAYVLGTFISGIDTVHQFLTHQESVYQRYAGTKLDANDLGLMMALSIPVSYWLLVKSRGKMVWVYRLQLVLAGTTVMLTASRGATLATIAALAIVPLTHARLAVRQKFAALLSLALLASAVLLFVPETSWKRLATVPSEFSQGTLNSRTVIWSAGWKIFREHPLVGIGANAFRLEVSRILAEPIRVEESSPAPPAHNTFLSVLVEQGVVGFAIFCALLGSLGFSVSTMPAASRQLWGVSSAVWVVGVSALTWEMRKPTWFFFGLLLAQAAVWQRENRAVN
jgi:O-antigen ligase